MSYREQLPLLIPHLKIYGTVQWHVDENVQRILLSTLLRTAGVRVNVAELAL